MKKADREHLGKVAALGCYACNTMGYEDTPAEIHHIRSGIGKGQRASNYQVIPLCPYHHRHGPFGEGFQSGPRAWQDKYGYELDIVDEINIAVGLNKEAAL